MKYLFIIFLLLFQSAFSLTEEEFHRRGRIMDNRLFAIRTEKKYIVLTIDDGPSHYTGIILDILRKNNTKATFFLVGSEIESYPHMVKKILAEGHEIGNHSYTHRDFKALSYVDILTNEIYRFNDILKENSGSKAIFIRPPYGSATSDQIDFLKYLGYYTISWSVDTLDWKHDWQGALETLKKKHHKGGILLMHSNKKAPYLLPEIIRELREEGYTFVSLGRFLSGRDLPPEDPPEDDRDLWEKRREFLKGSIKKSQ